MEIERRLCVLIFVDAVGISDGYKGIFNTLREKTGLGEKNVRVITRSAYSAFPKQTLLEWSKQRKQPGFNTREVYQRRTKRWVEDTIQQHAADLVVCMDPALLFLFNHDWNQATLDRLRGGVYIHAGIPVVISLPVTAWHSKMKAKDIAKLNEGFVEKGDFEEFRASEDGEENDLDEDEESTMEWHDPVVTPYGRVVLEFDLAKAGRLLEKMRSHGLARN